MCHTLAETLKTPGWSSQCDKSFIVQLLLWTKLITLKTEASSDLPALWLPADFIWWPGDFISNSIADRVRGRQNFASQLLSFRPEMKLCGREPRDLLVPLRNLQGCKVNTSQKDDIRFSTTSWNSSQNSANHWKVHVLGFIMIEISCVFFSFSVLIKLPISCRWVYMALE